MKELKEVKEANAKLEASLKKLKHHFCGICKEEVLADHLLPKCGHAFCLACVDDGVVNPYCKAAVWKTKTLYAPSIVLSDESDRNLGYWCEEDVISSIEQGEYVLCKEGVLPGMDCSSTPKSSRL